MSEPTRRSALIRLLLAWLITAAVLPYAVGRTFVMRMLIGRVEPIFALLLVLGLVAVWLLTRGHARTPVGARFRWLLGFGIPLTWIIANGVLIWLSVGSLIPKEVVFLLMVLSSLWAPWLAWIFYVPLAWPARISVLVVLLALGPIFPRLLRTEGLTGDARVNFAWRSSTPRQEYADVQAGFGNIDLPPVSESDYAQYLGPRRLAVLPDRRLARDWDRFPPRLLWRKPVGAGWGSFAVVGDYAITQEQRDKHECVVCYRVSDGATLWTHADEVRFDSGMGGSGPRATPTVADGRVYTMGATGLLNCLDGGTGRALWSVNVLQDNDGGPISHGVCGSPLLVDDLVIVCPTGTDKSMVAYRRATGERVWQAGQAPASYSSPMLVELAGQRQLLLYNAAGVSAHDVATGHILWNFPWTNYEGVNCSQPIPHAGGVDQVFIATGYGKGCALFRVEHPTPESWTASPVWDNRYLKAKFTTPVLHRGHIYGLDDGILTCIDATTGKRRWKDGRYQHGQVLLVGGLLLVQAEAGAVVLVEPVPEELRELGRFDALSGKTWNHPALVGRRLLVRNDQEAACYELAENRD